MLVPRKSQDQQGQEVSTILQRIQSRNQQARRSHFKTRPPWRAGAGEPGRGEPPPATRLRRTAASGVRAPALQQSARRALDGRGCAGRAESSLPILMDCTLASLRGILSRTRAAACKFAHLNDLSVTRIGGDGTRDSMSGGPDFSKGW